MSNFFRTLGAVVKTVSAQLYVALFGRRLLKKNIWIVGEKKTEARDNGYHFFRYLTKEHPEIDARYVITKNSPDRHKVEPLGPVVTYESFKHCVLYYAAKVRACSQIHGVKPFENVRGIQRFRFYKRKDQRHVNLKHGISKDFLPGSFDFRKVGFDLYIAGAKPEYEAIKEQFNYPDRNIALTGFCRFDALHDLPEPDKSILIMPTFRSWLRTSDSSKAAADPEEMARFKSSTFFAAYQSLLTDPRLLENARQHGYRIYFYLHYTFQPYIGAFSEFENDVVTVCKRADYDVQTLLKSSAVLITDYSSVFFDYGYMMKPMVFFQFDLDEYRDKHYKEGYFSYQRDAFGPLVQDPQAVTDYLIHLFQQDMRMDEEYENRAKRFFVPYDDHNCERVYQAILRLDEV